MKLNQKEEVDGHDFRFPVSFNVVSFQILSTYLFDFYHLSSYHIWITIHQIIYHFLVLILRNRSFEVIEERPNYDDNSIKELLAKTEQKNHIRLDFVCPELHSYLHILFNY